MSTSSRVGLSHSEFLKHVKFHLALGGKRRTTPITLLIHREKLGGNSRWKNSEIKGMMSATCGLQLCIGITVVFMGAYLILLISWKINNIICLMNTVTLFAFI